MEMGLTHGTLGALLLSDIIDGKNNPWAGVYDPGRFRWKAFPEFVEENANVACQYTHLLLPTSEKEEEVTESLFKMA